MERVGKVGAPGVMLVDVVDALVAVVPIVVAALVEEDAAGPEALRILYISQAQIICVKLRNPRPLEESMVMSVPRLLGA